MLLNSNATCRLSFDLGVEEITECMKPVSHQYFSAMMRALNGVIDATCATWFGSSVGRAMQAICMDMGLSPHLSQNFFTFPIFFLPLSYPSLLSSHAFYSISDFLIRL